MKNFDAIVVGSGMTGGWAAKELSEAGLKTLVIERGREVIHGEYPTENLEPWELEFRGEGDRINKRKHNNGQVASSSITGGSDFSEHWFANLDEAPYQTPEGKPFEWTRGHHLGGRSIMWSRHVPRWGVKDFEANAIDGYGVPWPISYDDVEPWYDYVEEFMGVEGMAEGDDQIPDGKFTEPFELNVVESHLRDSFKNTHDRTLTIGRNANLTEEREGRGLCQKRNQCIRGCSWGGYFSALSSTLPAAEKTGNLTTVTDHRVLRLIYDDDQKRVTGVEAFDMKTKETTQYFAKTVFLCASAFSSVGILLNTQTKAHPKGLGANSGILGRYIMDHCNSIAVSAVMTGFTDYFPLGRRPAYAIMPPFKNKSRAEFAETGFHRSYMPVLEVSRVGWRRGGILPGFGGDFKDGIAKPGPWIAGIEMSGECLPYETNHISLDYENLDPEGMPQLLISMEFGENETKLAEDCVKEGVAMLEAAGAVVVGTSSELATPGSSIHEMGGAPMGNDPEQSVLNANNQHHDALNLYVTDGACMNSSASQNPSLTYMALTARAAHHAIEAFKKGTL